MSTADLVALEAASGITRINLFRMFDMDDVIDAAISHPDTVFAWVDIPRGDDKHLILDETTIPFLEGYLETGLIHGLGELSLRHYPFGASPTEGDNNPADGDVLKEVYDLAAQYNVPVNVHLEVEWADELERAMAHNRDTKFIWAHAGDGPANTIADVLSRNENAYIDLSCRNDLYSRWIDTEDQRITESDGTLKDDWRSLFVTFPDRVMFGLDLGPDDRETMVPETVSYYLAVLDTLEPGVAQAIASGNMARLMGLTK
jgi:predicted TIM-barrel fold metal-dependent hydrolase